VRAERLNPSSLYNSVQFGFSHAVRQKGGDTLHLSGQVAWDKEGKVVGVGDLAAQTRQALSNLREVLASGGAPPPPRVRRAACRQYLHWRAGARASGFPGGNRGDCRRRMSWQVAKPRDGA
jgi:hypothetical protein